MRGDSSMVKKVRTAMVTMETTVENAASPTEKRGGRLQHLGELRGQLGRALREVLLQVQTVDQSAQRPVALLGLGHQVRHLLAEVKRRR